MQILFVFLLSDIVQTFFRNLFVAKEKCDSIARRTFCIGRSDGLWHKEILFTFTIYTNIIDTCTAIFVCNDFIEKKLYLTGGDRSQIKPEWF